MDTETLGRVTVAATIENLYDLEKSQDGLLADGDVRRFEVLDALIDTGATYVEMPRSKIDSLGLRLIETRTAKTTTGLSRLGIFGPVRLSIQGRTCDFRVSECAESCPILIGFIPLEMLDFVVDPKRRRLLGNPDHGGEFMIHMY